MPEFMPGPRKRPVPGTMNPFTKDAADLASAPRKPMRDGTSPDSSGSYKQRGNPGGAIGNAIDSIIQRKDPE